MKFLFLLLIILFITTPAIGEKSKGLFSGEILQADLDSFTSNVSDTPGYLSDNQSGVQVNPQDSAAWMDIGKTQLKSGNWKPAEETFSKVIELNPLNTDGWEGYLLAIRGGGNFVSLLEASERATKQNPGYASAWKYYGIALSSLDRSEEAITAFDKALESDPKYYDALYYKGIALDGLKRYNESVKAYEDVLSLNQKYTKAWNNKGVALMYTGRYDEAIIAFDKALSIDPGYKKASDNKGLAVSEKGKSSLGSVVTIDDGSVFIPSSSESESEEYTPIITVSPTNIPEVSSVTTEIQIPELISEPNIIPTLTSEIIDESSVKPTSIPIIEESSVKETISTGTKSGANMFRGNSAHTGEYPGPAATIGELKWKYKVGKYISSTPAITDGFVYVVSGDNNIYALNEDTGNLKWLYETKENNNSFFYSPTVIDGILFISSSEYLYALDAGTGSLKWKIHDSYSSSPVVVDDVVYIGASEYLYALDANTGDVKNKFEIQNAYDIVVDDGSIFVSTSVFQIENSILTYYKCSLNVETGSIIWKFKTNSAANGHGVSDGIIYFACDDGAIYALNAANGVLLWKFNTNLGGQSFSAPAVADGIVYVGKVDPYVIKRTNEYLFALDAKTGTLLWKYETKGSPSSPSIAENIVYVGTEQIGNGKDLPSFNEITDGSIYALDAKTGNLKWKYDTPIRASPAVNNGVVYFGGVDGYVYAFT